MVLRHGGIAVSDHHRHRAVAVGLVRDEMGTQVVTAEVVHIPRTESAVERAQDFMPVFDIKMALERQKAMSQFIGTILNESTPTSAGDYGVIPGTSKQKVLLKAGAEKLCTFFGLSPRFEAEEIIEDWTGDAHGGEPLFYYRYKCQLWRGDRLLAEAVGSCNSREKKYRYRSGERKCPACSIAAIIKGKAEYGGGWLCFARKGGCGAKYADNDATITGQETGQVINPDVADSINTIQKMAQKRALVAVVLIATNASDSFTQDMEDVAEIDTGGHPIGTQAAQDHVREQKLQAAQQRSAQRDKPPNPQPPSAAGGHSHQNGGTGGAQAEDPELCALLDRATKSKQERASIMGELGSKLDQVIGVIAYDALWAELTKRIGDPDANLGNGRKMIEALWRHLQKVTPAKTTETQPEMFSQGEAAYAND